MEWLYLLIAWVPIVSMIAGLVLVVIGLIMRRKKKWHTNAILALGLGCMVTCMAIGVLLFLAGALGIGPVPN